MPIEIKELIIRASVRDAPAQDTTAEAASKPSSPADAAREERIVSRCVEQIMEILRTQNER